MKKFLSIIMAATLFSSLVACGSSKDASKSTDILTKIKEKGELVVATSPDYPPYEFKILEDGKEKIVGFDIAIAEEIAKDLGVKLTISEMDFKGLLVDLNAGKSDIVMAGMSPDEKRREAVDFSEIYYYSEQAILVTSDKKDELNSLESLKGKKVGVQQGSIQEKIANEQIPDADIVPLVKIPNVVLDLKTGKLDAAIIELPVAEGYVKQFSELAISDAKVQNEDGGAAVAIKKGNEPLVDQVNSTLERLEAEDLINQFVIEANDIASNMIE